MGFKKQDFGILDSFVSTITKTVTTWRAYFKVKDQLEMNNS
jgi:hypothetical protein